MCVLIFRAFMPGTSHFKKDLSIFDPLFLPDFNGT
jgi:hypothetical protein